jgi:alkaline phosphatase D
VLDSLQASRCANPVILGGDIHAFVVGNINAVAERFDTPLVAAEFVATSITSDPQPQESMDKWRPANPNLLRLDGTHRGYLSLHLDEKRMKVELVGIDDRTRLDASRLVVDAYVVEDGNPAIKPA